MRLRRRTPASESPPPSQRGKRKMTRASQGRKRARATGCEEDKNAEAAAADSASPPAEHASSGASSGVSSPLRRPSLARTVIGVGAFGAQILEPFHKLDPNIVKAYGNLKNKYFAKRDRQLKLVTLDKHIPRSCMSNSKLIPVRESATKLILQIAKNVVGFSSHIDGKLLRRTSSFLIDWDADKKVAIVLTSALLIQSKPPSSDEWSATDDYSPHAELENFLLDMCEKHLDEGNGIGSSVDLSIGIFHVRKDSHRRIKMSVNVSNDTEVIAIGTYPVTAAHFIMVDDDGGGGGMVQGRVASREAHDDEDYIESYPSSHHDTRMPSEEVDDN